MSQYFAKVADDFNVLPLQLALNAKPEMFGRHGERQATYAHKAMTDIWVRYNTYENFGPNFNDEHDSVWYPAYYELPELKPLLFGLMALVDGERLGGVLITKVPAGGRIEPHTDAGWHASFYDKFYIPIQNENGAVFCWENGRIEPNLGEVYWFRNDIPHWVENRSSADRLSLIVCIKTEKSALWKP